MLIADAKAVEAFYKDADAYCNFIEALDEERPTSLYTKLEAFLSQLAYTAPKLPVGIFGEENHKSHRISHDDCTALTKKAGVVLGPDIGMSITRHGQNMESVVRISMLLDDLVDIYRDLKEGVSLYIIGEENSVYEAAWEWRFGFEHHWGEHLYKALLTVHEMRYRLNKK